MEDNALARQGYEHYYGMLADKVRMQAYRKAIFQTVKPGDVVVDLGAGTGLLGIWAIQAGARKVYAIEKTSAIELAKQIARANHCLEKIEFINKNSVDVTLPEPADVLISETLGSFGVDENTLQFTIDARKRFLAAQGRMIPQTVEMFAAPVDDPNSYHKIDFWRHLPGVDFTPAFDLFAKKIMVESVRPDGLLSEKKSLGVIDLTTVAEPVFQARDYITVNKPGTIHGVAGWFKVILCDGVVIDTSPGQLSTHWKQAFFPFQNPIEVIRGDVLDWSVNVAPRQSDSDDTKIEYSYRCTQLKNEILPAAIGQQVGRNEMCPCGSGQKYKKCCMA